MLELTVHEMYGNCRVHKLGDKITIKNPDIVLSETDALCINAMPRIVDHAQVLEYNWCPLKLGLTKEDDPDHAYFQCLEPGKERAAGCVVVYRAEKPKAEAW